MSEEAFNKALKAVQRARDFEQQAIDALIELKKENSSKFSRWLEFLKAIKLELK